MIAVGLIEDKQERLVPRKVSRARTSKAASFSMTSLFSTHSNDEAVGLVQDEQERLVPRKVSGARTLKAASFSMTSQFSTQAKDEEAVGLVEHTQDTLVPGKVSSAQHFEVVFSSMTTQSEPLVLPSLHLDGDNSSEAEEQEASVQKSFSSMRHCFRKWPREPTDEVATFQVVAALSPDVGSSPCRVNCYLPPIQSAAACDMEDTGISPRANAHPASLSESEDSDAEWVRGRKVFTPTTPSESSPSFKSPRYRALQARREAAMKSRTSNPPVTFGEAIGDEHGADARDGNAVMHAAVTQGAELCETGTSKDPTTEKLPPRHALPLAALSFRPRIRTIACDEAMDDHLVESTSSANGGCVAVAAELSIEGSDQPAYQEDAHKQTSELPPIASRSRDMPGLLRQARLRQLHCAG